MADDTVTNEQNREDIDEYIRKTARATVMKRGRALRKPPEKEDSQKN